MSRRSRSEKADASLAALESEFERRLTAALKICAAGQWGLFASQPESGGTPGRLRTEGDELARLGEDIRVRRRLAGISEDFWLGARFAHYRFLFGANDPGEPKRAQAFLGEIGARRAH